MPYDRLSVAQLGYQFGPYLRLRIPRDDGQAFHMKDFDESIVFGRA